MLSSHSIVSSSWTVRPCSPWGGRWIGHWRTTWSTACSSAPHSQAAEEAIPHLYKQEQKHPTPVQWRLSQTQPLLGKVIPGGGCRCRGWKCGVLWGCPPTPHSIGDPPTAPHACCYCQRNWRHNVGRVQIGVSIWDAMRLHSIDGWALSGADVNAPCHGVLETVWFHCDEAQQVEYLRGLEGCPLVLDAGIQSQFARRRWWRGRWGGYEHCGTKQERITLHLNVPGLGWLFAELLLQHPTGASKIIDNEKMENVGIGLKKSFLSRPTRLQGVQL